MTLVFVWGWEAMLGLVLPLVVPMGSKHDFVGFPNIYIVPYPLSWPGQLQHLLTIFRATRQTDVEESGGPAETRDGA